MKKSLSSLFKNYGFYLWPVLVAVIIIGIMVKVDLPKLKEINRIRQELVSVQERLAKLGAKSSLLGSLDEEKLKVDYEKTNLVLPDGKDAPSILRTLEACTSSSGVFLENLDLAPGKLATEAAGSVPGEEKMTEILIKVTMAGTIPQTTAFLGKVTSVGRAIGFKDLELSFEEGSASAKVDLTLLAYYLFTPSTVSKIDEPLPTLGQKEEEVQTQMSQRDVPIYQPVLFPAGKIDLFK